MSLEQFILYSISSIWLLIKKNTCAKPYRMALNKAQKCIVKNKEKMRYFI